MLSPLVIWRDIIYLSNEHSCFISFANPRSTLWAALNTYGIPLFCLLIMYIRITVFIRQQSNDRNLRVKHRQERDLLVIQRIFILVSILIILGIPGMVLVLIMVITGVEHPLTYRITWFAVSVSMVILSITKLYMTPQLKNIVVRWWQRNRVIPVNAVLANSIRMRTVQRINHPTQT
jgi:hypothetical protein